MNPRFFLPKSSEASSATSKRTLSAVAFPLRRRNIHTLPPRGRSPIQCQGICIEGPGLKARLSIALFHGPEGPCSLRCFPDDPAGGSRESSGRSIKTEGAGTFRSLNEARKEIAALAAGRREQRPLGL